MPTNKLKYGYNSSRLYFTKRKDAGLELHQLVFQQNGSAGQIIEKNLGGGGRRKLFCYLN